MCCPLLDIHSTVVHQGYHLNHPVVDRFKGVVVDGVDAVSLSYVMKCGGKWHVVAHEGAVNEGFYCISLLNDQHRLFVTIQNGTLLRYAIMYSKCLLLSDISLL